MLDETCRISVNFRIEKARNCLNAAETLLSVGSYADSTNRSYYCIFHAMRAVLITVGFSSKTHSGNIAEFRRRFIKTSVFPNEFSDIIGSAFEIRNDSDYEDFYIVSKDESEQQAANAKVFFKAVEDYINTL
ncbi:MAG: HEPN domain-containing protein [Spirochaetaceae bacterium]|nr:HEPN domain-containing protein [Spirochaetaceae bacterium]